MGVAFARGSNSLARASRGLVARFVLLLLTVHVGVPRRGQHQCAVAGLDDDGAAPFRRTGNEGAVAAEAAVGAYVAVTGVGAVGRVERPGTGERCRNQHEAGNDDCHQHGDALAKGHFPSLSPLAGIVGTNCANLRPCSIFRQNRTSIYYHKRDKIAIVFSTWHYCLIWDVLGGQR